MNLCYNSSNGTRTSVGLFFLRLIAGLAFMLHGWPKIQHAFNWMGADTPVPSIFQALAAFSEFGGGLAWVIGLLTPLASLGILFTMAVATFFHVSHGDPFVSMGGAAYEPALLYFVIALLLKLAGPGKFSLDAKLFEKKK